MSSTNPSLVKNAVYGAGAGVVASLVMAMYAMIASWAKDTGFFTPLYHIASLWISPKTLMASMEDGMANHAFHFAFGAAVLGAIIHMMTGAMYGAIFGVIASRLRLGLPALAGVGMVYGFVVFVVSAFIALPVAAAIFSSGDQITDMAKMAGWATFIIEHLMFGVALGVLYAVRRRSVSVGAAATATA
ncbi:hypothetical protein AB0E63_33575 [Kribbella sp. NPDC026596]|uniref:hypothetical protein n=1 Tax=Kribbella sp. NPDC026596 TaxID=3155122 RepID=UPI003405B98B